jgi:protein TonB
MALGISLILHALIVSVIGMELRQPPPLVNPIEVTLGGAAMSAKRPDVSAPLPVPVPQMPKPVSLPPATAVPRHLSFSTPSIARPTVPNFDPNKESSAPVVARVPAPSAVPLSVSGKKNMRSPTQRDEQGKRGSEDSSSLTSYFNAIRARVDAAKRYPPMAQQRRLQGVVVVTFTLTPNGRLSGAPVVSQGSGFKQLDDAALLAISRGAPYPPFPLDPKKMKALQIPVKFHLR